VVPGRGDRVGDCGHGRRYGVLQVSRLMPTLLLLPSLVPSATRFSGSITMPMPKLAVWGNDWKPATGL